MYTECPSCQTFFKITPNQLKAAGGKVRCGNCDEVFSALDGLVDVVPEDVVANPDNKSEQISEQIEAPNSELNSETKTEENPEIDDDLAESQAELSAALSIQLESEAQIEADAEGFTQIDSGIANDLELPENSAADPGSLSEISLPAEENEESNSFADVEIPGMDADTVKEDVELALESAVVEEPKEESEESKTITRQEEINNDIDAALDGLFDGNTELEDPQSVLVSTPEPEAVSELSAISDLDELQDLDFGDLGSADEAKSKSESKFEPQQSEAVSLGLGDAGNLENEVSSLSEFERELEEVSAAAPLQNNSEPLADSSFDLGDSFLDSELSKSVSKSDEKSKEKGEEAERRGDSYILEEIEGKKKSKSGGGSILAKMVWIVVILVLLAVLLGQFAFLKRQDLAMNPEIKPVIEELCAKLNEFYPCDITPAKDVKAIELLERNVVSHPNAKNALLITSTIENKATFDQAFPDLVLTFSDINQKIIAKRKFSPTEYLSKDVDIEAGMKKLVPVKIMLEIVDPGEEAVNFEFSFQ